MRGLLLGLLLLSTPALALDQSQIQAACYIDCEKETGSNPDYKACLARAGDTADAVLNQEFSTLQDSVSAAAKDMDVKPDAQLDMLKEAQRKWVTFPRRCLQFRGQPRLRRHGHRRLSSSCICALSYGRINDFERISIQSSEQ